MLDALKSLDNKQKEGILSKMALRLMPSPNDDGQVLAQEEELYKNVLEEIRKRTRLSSGDNSNKARTKIIHYLSEELSRLIFLESDISETKSRIGQKGNLRPDQYDVEFSKSFIESFVKLGIPKRLAERTVHYPDSVEHFDPQKEGVEGASLYLKYIPTSRQVSDYYLLVSSIRSGNVQLVDSAWVVFPSEVNINDGSSPLDVLKSFVSVYGVDFVFAGHKARFMFYRRIPVDAWSIRAKRIGDFLTIEKSEHQYIWSMEVARFYDPPSLMVTIGFCVDGNKYVSDLRNHGFCSEFPSLFNPPKTP